MKHSFGFFQHGNPPEVHLVTGSYFSNMAKRKTALPDNGVVSCGESDFHKNYALQNVNSQVVVGRKDCFVYIAAVEAVVVVVAVAAAVAGIGPAGVTVAGVRAGTVHTLRNRILVGIAACVLVAGSHMADAIDVETFLQSLAVHTQH